tara:strand:+ start:590 stop:787 length:198 start_codon:yes stop_codon:yes gene_type:complete
MEDLLDYIERIGQDLMSKGFSEDLLTEITKIAVDNWMDSGNPKLSDEQMTKAITLYMTNRGFNSN